MRVDRIEEGLEKRKKQKNASSEERLRDTFNEASEMLINRFMGEVLSGSRELESTADLARLFNIYMQVNDLNTGDSMGDGMLPEISPSKLNIIEETMPTSKTIVDGEEETVIDLNEVAELSAEDIAKMLMDTEEEMNKQNEGTF